MSGSHLCITRIQTVHCAPPYYTNTELKCSVSQFLHSYICEIFIYFQDWSVYFAAAKYVDRSWEYINRSQTHECGNRDWGRTIPRKGIHKWDIPCIVIMCWGGGHEVGGERRDDERAHDDCPLHERAQARHHGWILYIVKGFYYIEFQSFCPVAWIRSSNPLHRKRVCLPSNLIPGGTHSLAGEGERGPNSDDRKSGLCLV
jgi:hypothetical protein